MGCGCKCESEVQVCLYYCIVLCCVVILLTRCINTQFISSLVSWWLKYFLPAGSFQNAVPPDFWITWSKSTNCTRFLLQQVLLQNQREPMTSCPCLQFPNSGTSIHNIIKNIYTCMLCSVKKALLNMRLCAWKKVPTWSSKKF